MKDKIGTAAGKIWHHLNTAKAPQPLDKIRKATDLTPVVATLASRRQADRQDKNPAASRRDFLLSEFQLRNRHNGDGWLPIVQLLGQIDRSGPIKKMNDKPLVAHVGTGIIGV